VFNKQEMEVHGCLTLCSFRLHISFLESKEFLEVHAAFT